MIWEIAVAAVLVGAVDAEVDTLDKQHHRGTLVDWNATELTLETTDGRKTLPLGKLLAVRPAAPAGKAMATPAVWLELVDESKLAGLSYTASEGQVTLKLLDDSSVDIPTKLITAARFKQQDAKIAAQWAQIRQAKATGDLIVVRKNEAIDFLEGVIGDVTEELVNFKLDGEAVPVKRAKVEGLIYFHASAPELAERRCVIHTADGLDIQGQSVRWEQDELEITLTSGLKLRRPWASIAQVDYAAGNVAYLSDLVPESATWTPYFGLPKDAATLARAGMPRNDQSQSGGLLKLGREYAKGISLRSRTEIVYRLPEKSRTFSAVAGIDDRVRSGGNVRLVINGDERVLYEGQLTGHDAPLELELSVQGVKRLKILVDYGDDLDVADYLDLCEAKISK